MRRLTAARRNQITMASALRHLTLVFTLVSVADATTSSASASVTRTVTPTRAPSPTDTASASPSAAGTPSHTPTGSVTPTAPPSITATPTPSTTPSRAPVEWFLGVTVVVHLPGATNLTAVSAVAAALDDCVVNMTRAVTGGAGAALLSLARAGAPPYGNLSTGAVATLLVGPWQGANSSGDAVTSVIAFYMGSTAGIDYYFGEFMAAYARTPGGGAARAALLSAAVTQRAAVPSPTPSGTGTPGSTRAPVTVVAGGAPQGSDADAAAHSGVGTSALVGSLGAAAVACVLVAAVVRASQRRRPSAAAPGAASARMNPARSVARI